MSFSCLFRFFVIPALVLGVVPSLCAQEKQDPGKAHAAAEAPKEGAKDSGANALSVTDHSIQVGGKLLKYKVTTGYLVLKEESEKPPGKADEKGGGGEPSDPGKDNLKPKARVFFVAYTIEGADLGTRPISFAFNGGPGAASVWLHIGALGPRRVKLTDLGDGTAPPYRLVDNEYTWLDQTDLVFIDPVSTGYSRAVAGESARSFHGFNEDLQSVAQFIRLYTTQNNRWLSPKLLVGESYGGTRAAALAGVLEDRFDMYLNGIVIISGVLDWQTIDFNSGNDLGYSLYLPSYAAAAWYHKMLPAPSQQKSEEDVRREAEAFAGTEYLLALERGNALSEADRTKIAQRLSELIGISSDTILRNHLKLTPSRFRDELLKAQHRTIGRFDDRFTGIAYDPDGADFEPSFAMIRGSYTAAINAYLRSELKFQTDLPYESLANVSPWNFGNFENRYVQVTDSLASAMTKNPHLKVWVISGYYDLAVSYFSTDHALRQMHLDPSLLQNLRFSKYESGHMLYNQESILKQFTADFGDFIGGALRN